MSGKKSDTMNFACKGVIAISLTLCKFTTTDPTTLPKNKAARDAKAFKKWVFKTDESGVVFGSNESFLVEDKSDKLFYDTYEDGSKVVIFPCGTYVLEETNAPAGFTQPSFNFRTFITTITPKENSTKQNPESFGKVIYIPQKRDDSKFEGLGWEAW